MGSWLSLFSLKRESYSGGSTGNSPSH